VWAKFRTSSVVVLDRWLTPALPVALIAASIACFTQLLISLDRGFDITDESHSVLWLQNPSHYALAASFFGYPLHMLDRLAGGNIVAVRWFGVIILGALAALALILLSRPAGRSEAFGPTGHRGPRWATIESLSLVAVAVAAQVFYYSYWRPTPSYNWLVTATGLLLASALALLRRPETMLVSIGFAGLAGVLTALAKPPSALLFALIYLAALVATAGSWSDAARRAGFAAALTLAIAVAFALILPTGRLIAQGRMLYDNYAQTVLADSDHGYRLRQFVTSGDGRLLLAAFALSIVQIAIPTDRRNSQATIVALICGCLVLAAIGWLQAWVFHLAGAALTLMALAAISLAALWPAPGLPRTDHKLLLIAILIPWAGAIGTTNVLQSHTIFHAGIAAVVTLAALAALRTRGAMATYLGAVVILAMVSGTIRHFSANPYRSATSLAGQTEPTRLPVGTVRVDVDTKVFLETLAREAHRQGFKPKQVLLDLSGELPGVAVALDALPPVTPWLLGGYPNSPTFARWVWRQIPPEERARLWISTMDGERRIPLSVLKQLGIELDRDYVVVAEAPHPIYRLPVRLYAPRRTQ